MSELAERILEQALRLPFHERVDLVERLIETLTTHVDPNIDAWWAAEAESRVAAYHRGETASIPAQDVFDEI